MKLEVIWQEHELGLYPVIGLTWEDPFRGVPSDYVSRCEAALAAYENGGELPPGWRQGDAESRTRTPGAIRASGTTQLCKRLSPEEINLSIRFERDLPKLVGEQRLLTGLESIPSSLTC